MDNSVYQIGISGWSYDEWRGVFYPANWAKKKWLEYYATQFSTVEINATFYRWFKDAVYLGWYERAPKNFQYILKIPRLISHRAYLNNIDHKIAEFYQSAQILKDKLGLFLLQLPPNFPYDLDRIYNFLEHFPDPSRLVIEFRAMCWFNEEVKALLRKYNVITCLADSPRTKLVDWLTSDIAYIRLHGRYKWFDYTYSHQELIEVTQLARFLHKTGAKKIYVFFNNTVKAYAIKNALMLQKILISNQ